MLSKIRNRNIGGKNLGGGGKVNTPLSTPSASIFSVNLAFVTVRSELSDFSALIRIHDTSRGTSCHVNATLPNARQTFRGFYDLKK
jgi:hypothetical protein